MCGRYALSLTPAQVRRRLANQNMQAEEAPEDDDDRLRQTYNFAPSYHGLVYRAQTSDRGESDRDEPEDTVEAEQISSTKAMLSHSPSQTDGRAKSETRYKLQVMKWGLVPFWTKRPPDYGSQMKTINCRDDSLIENRGMWNTMKQRKRCVVVAEGFYEWLKKNNGKEKLPHFVKRKDGELMIMAGLWDMVVYEGSEERLYTYTIITTDSNEQLKFLHDRMPVILEPGSSKTAEWLDPSNVGWSKSLQSTLKPFDGELECYPVDKAVGKVGNNSPAFVVPIDSKENKKNIANFFQTQRATAKDVAVKNEAAQSCRDEDRCTTTEIEVQETNAPLPKPKYESKQSFTKRIDTITSPRDKNVTLETSREYNKGTKRELSGSEESSAVGLADRSTTKKIMVEEQNPAEPILNNRSQSTQKTRSATTNKTTTKTPTKESNAKITSFFN